MGMKQKLQLLLFSIKSFLTTEKCLISFSPLFEIHFFRKTRNSLSSGNTEFMRVCVSINIFYLPHVLFFEQRAYFVAPRAFANRILKQIMDGVCQIHSILAHVGSVIHALNRDVVKMKRMITAIAIFY